MNYLLRPAHLADRSSDGQIRVLKLLRVLIAIFVVLTWCGWSTVVLAEGWRAGAAKQVITPKEPMWMSGYGGRTAPASGKFSELHAKALVLEADGQKPGVIITLDLVGIDRELSRRIAGAVSERLGCPVENVVISTSHTHSGPAVGKNLGALHYYQLSAPFQKQIDEYADKLFQDCVDVAVRARDLLAPCKVTWGTGHVDFATNRRANKEADVPKLRTAGKLAGPVDHDVPVLAIRDSTDKVRALLFGYACHATVLSGYDWCADYPGYAQSNLEQRFPGSVALFFAGCGADQNPLPRRTVEIAEHYGRRLATAVEAVLMTTEMTPASPKLVCQYAETPLPLDKLPTAEQLKVQQTSSNKSEAARASILLKQIAETGSISKTYPYPVSHWKIGDDLNFVALGGEVVVDYAIRIKSELKGPTWIAGYAHDVMAYIPSRRVLMEGGYEGAGAMVYYGLPSPWAPEVEEIIIRQVKALGKP